MKRYFPALEILSALLLGFLLIGCGISPAQDNPDHPLLVRKLIEKADSLAAVTTGDTAAKFISGSFHQVIPQAGVKDRELLYNWLSNFYLTNTRNYQDALAYSDSSLMLIGQHLKASGSQLLYAQAFLDRGNILFKLDRFDEAYSFYYRAKLEVAKEGISCENASLLFSFYANLANISYGQNHFVDAINQERHAIACFTNCGKGLEQAYLIQGAYDNMGLSFMQLSQPDSALTYYRQALDEIKAAKPVTPKDTVQFRIAEGVVLGNMGSAFAALKRYEDSDHCFEQSIAINSLPGYANQDALMTKIRQAETYLSRGKLQAAARLINRIDTFRPSLPVAQDSLRFLSLKARYLDSVGNFREAAKTLNNYVNKEAGLRQRQVHVMRADYGKEFELLERQYVLENYIKKNQQQQILLTAAAIICAMIITLLVVLVRHRRKAKVYAERAEAHNRELTITLEALASSVQENDRLMRVLAHDLKNPLGAIQGITNLLLSEVRSPDDTEMLDLIKSSSETMNSIIHDLLAAKAHNPRDPATVKTMDLKELVTECINLLQYRAKEKGQQIVFRHAVSCFVDINKERKWRVMNNLLVNAIKFSPVGCRIEVSLSQTATEAIVSVRDHGIGIPESLRDHVFELSTIARRKGTAEEESYGLGLYTSKQIMEEAGGRIWFESEPGKGTVFYIALPLSSARL